MFCEIPIPFPGTSVTSVRLVQYSGYGYTSVRVPGEPGLRSGLTQRMRYAFLIETIIFYDSN